QSVIAYIGVLGKGLREGMYLRGNLSSQVIQSAVQLPIELLVNQNQVYVVKDDQLVLQDIEIVNTNAENATVKGLTDGQLLLREKIIGAYEGLEVKPVELTASTDGRR
ncbi:MAG: efflux transporter periplasmic adaptor subunit, partial [Bacteroidota bacterium]